VRLERHGRQRLAQQLPPHRVGIFSRAQERHAFDVPAGLADPHVIPRHDEHDADPAVVAAITSVRPIRPAAVLVPIIERDEPSVLFTQRTAHSPTKEGRFRFPAARSMPVTKARRRQHYARPIRRSRFAASLSSRSGISTFTRPLRLSHRTRARDVRPGFALRLNRDKADDAFEVPLAFLIATAKS